MTTTDQLLKRFEKDIRSAKKDAKAHPDRYLYLRYMSFITRLFYERRKRKQ